MSHEAPPALRLPKCNPLVKDLGSLPKLFADTSLFVQNKAREVVSDLSDQKPQDIQDSHQLRLIDLCNLVPRRTIPGLWLVDL